MGVKKLSLYYHNLPNVASPSTTSMHARMSLQDIETYLYLARERQLKQETPLVRWALHGYYYEIYSEDISKTEITNILSKKHELREIKKSGEKELQLASKSKPGKDGYEYPPELRMIVLNSSIDPSQEFHLKTMDDDKVHVVELKQIKSDRIGGDVKLPHYRIQIRPFNQIDDPQGHWRKFFNDYHKWVQDLSLEWITKSGIVRRMLKRQQKLFQPRKRINIKHKDIQNRVIHLTRMPSSEAIALQPNTYVIERQLNAIRKLKESPLSEHRSLIRLFEMEFFVKWPDVRNSGEE